MCSRKYQRWGILIALLYSIANIMPNYFQLTKISNNLIFLVSWLLHVLSFQRYDQLQLVEKRLLTRLELLAAGMQMATDMGRI